MAARKEQIKGKGDTSRSASALTPLRMAMQDYRLGLRVGLNDLPTGLVPALLSQGKSPGARACRERGIFGIFFKTFLTV